MRLSRVLFNVARRNLFVSIASALALSACAVAQPGALKAGAARIEITPPLAKDNLPPTGNFENEHLYVRAIVLDNGTARVALIGAEQGSLTDNVWNTASKEIAKELNCPLTNVLMSATHIHSAGVPAGPGGAGPENDARVAKGMLEAVRAAKGKLQPAKMAFGTGMAYLNVNRDAIQPVTHLWTQATNLNAFSDKTVAVLKIEDMSGHPMGVYVNYAMHPVNGYLANFTSADYAGAMSEYIEDAYGANTVAIFTQGASGDQNPLYLRAATNGMASRSDVAITGNVLVREDVEQPLRDNKVPSKPMDAKTRERLQRFMESEGEVLGEEVIRVMTNSTRYEDHVKLAGAESDITCPGRKRTDSGREGMEGAYTDAPPVPIHIGMVGIGDVALTWVNAEVYSLISEKTKKQSPMANTVFVTLANGRAPSGYIPDDASYGHKSFQVLGSSLKVGCAEDSISNGLTKLIVNYSESK